MNYMEQVAKMIGVKLDEEFKVKNSKTIYKINTNGLFYLNIDKEWPTASYMLMLILAGQKEIVKKPILDDIEKEYLSGIIKPFRNRVKDIVKHGYGCYEYIEIRFYSENIPMGNINLPYYEKSSMYKGMEINRKYTLEELGLWAWKIK